MKNVIQIDINADVGEGIGNEADLMPYLSSCNIACGGHAGDLASMRAIVKLAIRDKVKIGAHPSFPDKLNFGREIMELSATDLYASLKHQIRSLQAVLQNEGACLNHIKPHGALYNLAAKDEKTARVIIEVINSIASPIKLYASFNSVLAKVAKQAEVEVLFEAFADRNYNEDLSLVSRKNKDAILHEKEAVLNHILNMIKYQKVKSVSGVEVPIKASTICVHGDTDNAIEIVRYLSGNLKKYNIQIQ
ncbi:5-oxoprolinase subunit PxpA [Winogradskyella sp. SM1960]|uniref:5-oxoprolinase subunit PxpA n=1 Tax=Winogradskyella sp. SM1960 TaxID=2865955 RepID=UPI001CD26825|nr:5-oxoprolinase subunit PxpA [Winogradskyella sp. SM1960]